MIAAPFQTAHEALLFMQAGAARVTLRSKSTGTRFTYRLKRPKKEPDLLYVCVLFNRDNERDFRYLGTIRENRFSLTARSAYKVGSPCYVAFGWSWRKLLAGELPATLEIWHEGRCGCCGRLLTVPESIASGFGPECRLLEPRN